MVFGLELTSRRNGRLFKTVDLCKFHISNSSVYSPLFIQYIKIIETTYCFIQLQKQPFQIFGKSSPIIILCSLKAHDEWTSTYNKKKLRLLFLNSIRQFFKSFIVLSGIPIFIFWLNNHIFKQSWRNLNYNLYSTLLGGLWFNVGFKQKQIHNFLLNFNTL